MLLAQTRRRLLATGAAGWVAGSSALHATASSTIGLLLPGKRDDGGFMQAGYAGFDAACLQLGATAAIADGIRPQPDDLVAALRKLASAKPVVIAAHGGQCSEAARIVAVEEPSIQFVVIQGNVEGPNLTSYEVLQEQSAWLAGAAAALLTKTGVVGHISGIRVPPGLKGRAGYAAGVKHVRPDVKLLTTFCGEQDDPDLAARVTRAQAEAGADVIFTMLNAGRTGAIAACRQLGVRQIGNVRDWYADAPDVFVGSAIANVSVAMKTAVIDAVSGELKPGQPKRLGVESTDAVRLALAPDVPSDVKTAIQTYTIQIASGALTVPAEYSGAEFSI